MNKKTLILGAAGGYVENDLSNFVKTLRNFYKKSVFFIVSNDIENQTKKFFFKYKINLIYTKYNPKILYKKRYEIYYDFLIKNKYDKILITDTRDVIFQADPFKNKLFDNLIFFLEDKIIKECNHNSRWIKKLYNKKELKNIEDCFISCSGTTIGKYNYIIEYLDIMKEHINKTRYISINQNKGTDQGNHNFIIHNNILSNYKILKNSDGYVATLSNSNPANFKYKKYFQNKNNKKFNIIHQYDRFMKKKIKLNFFFTSLIDNLIKRK